jgi:hypothetical protein
VADQPEPQAEPLPCEFVEEDCGPEHGYRCTACGGWFGRLICDGVRITNRWWHPEEECRDHA